MASVSASIMSSVSGVSGAARTTKSDSASSSGSASGPPTRSSMISPSGRPSSSSAWLGAASRSPRRRTATTRQPNAVASAPTARPIEPEPDDPDRHVAQLGALERLPRPLALELEQLGQPPADGQDHHQDVLGDRPAEDAAGVGDDDAALERGRGQRALHAGGRRVDPRRRGARTRRRSNASELSQPRSMTSTSSSGPSASPSTETLTSRAPGAAARIRSRSRDR